MKKAARAALTTILTLTLINTYEIMTKNPIIATLIGHAEANTHGGVYIRTTNHGAHIYAMPNMPGGNDIIATQRGNVMMIQKQYVNAPDIIRHEHTHQKQFQQLGSIGTQLLAHYYIITGTTKYGNSLCAYYNSPLETEAYKNQFGQAWTPPHYCDYP
jgi:hypothetical protein